MTPLGNDIVNQLSEHGLDITKLYTFEFFFYFNNGDDAEDAMDVLNHKGFDVVVPTSSDHHKWVIKAIIALIPATDIAKLNRWEQDFNEIADHYSGEFDGWGAYPK